MNETIFTTAEIEQEWARRGIQSNSGYRLTDDLGPRFWDPIGESWYQLSESAYRGLLAVYALRFYGLECRPASRTKPWRFCVSGRSARRRGRGVDPATAPLDIEACFEKADAAVLAILKLTPFEPVASTDGAE